MDYIFVLLILSATIGKAISSLQTRYYPTGYEAVNKGVLYDLGNGFQGRYSFIHSNATGINVAYGLWFVNATNEEYYLCLLEFKNISTATTFNPAPAQIVWCANTDGHIHAPVSSGATLTFQTDGNLVLKDTQGVSVFETGTAGQGVSYLGIDYWVNLLLVAADGTTVIWKSHKSPVNTLVLVQGFTSEMRLTSWSSSTNNSQGPYSMVMESGGVALYYDDSPYWVFSNGSPNTIQSVKNANTQVYAYLCTDNGKKAGLVLSSNYSNLYTTGETTADCLFFLSGSLGKMGKIFYFGSTVIQNYAITTFMKLQPDGNLGAYYWDNEKYNWSRFFLLFNSLCDLPGSCGDYGICKDEKCSCPPSFVVNNLTLGCELGKKTTGFQDLQGITYFSNEYSDPDFVSQNYSACKILCEKNTSCAAAFYNQTSSSCHLVQKVRTMKWTSDQNCVAFLKLGATSAGSISKPSHHISVGIIIGSILASVVGIIIIVVAMVFKLRKSPPDQENNMDLKSNEIPVMQEHSQHDHVVGPVRYSYSQIEELTSGFSTLIGTGGFAKVYKGVVPNYGEVAIKVLDAAWYEGKDFFAEMSILEKIHHVNLVELIGYCLQEPHRILIYDYLPNGSLDKWIFGHLTSLLSWDIRFKLALGVAQGMAYLHEGCKHRILHLDLKPQNILLDSNFIPKVADFGLSRFMNKDQSIMMTNTLRGTPGYMAPDLLAEGGVTYKADVYSYGVVVLEILYGRKSGELYDKLKNVVVDENEDDESHMLDIIDISNLTPIQKKQASRALQVTLLCLETEPASRPSMTEIVQMLQGLISIPSIPPTQRRLFSWGVMSSSNTSKTNASSSSAFPLSEQSTR